MPEPAAAADDPALAPARRGWSVVAGIVLVLVILGLLAAMWMPALVGVQPPGPPDRPNPSAAGSK